MQVLKHCPHLDYHICCQGELRAEICRTRMAAACLDQDNVNCFPPTYNTEKELQVSSYFWTATFSQETCDTGDKSHFQDRLHWQVFQTSFPFPSSCTWPVQGLQPHLRTRKPSGFCENTSPIPQSLLWVAAQHMAKQTYKLCYIQQS